MHHIYTGRIDSIQHGRIDNIQNGRIERPKVGRTHGVHDRTDRGGGLRHRGKEKRGVAYNRYDPVSNGTQWQGMVYLVEYIMEYNWGASAIGVKSNFF